MWSRQPGGGYGGTWNNFQVETNVHTPSTHTHRQDPVTVTSYLHMTTDIYTDSTQHPTHTAQRYGAHFDNRQVDLALVRVEWSKKSKTDPREGWGFCVCGVSHFITRETHNRPRKTFEALGGVCGNRLCGYLWCQLQYSDCRLFPGLGLCLLAERETVRRLHIRADELITASHQTITKYFTHTDLWNTCSVTTLIYYYYDYESCDYLHIQDWFF